METVKVVFNNIDGEDKFFILEKNRGNIFVKTKSDINTDALINAQLIKNNCTEDKLFYQDCGGHQICAYNINEGEEKSRKIKNGLLKNKDVLAAGTAYTNTKNGEVVLYNEEAYIYFSDDITIDECHLVLSEHNLSIKKHYDFIGNVFLVTPPENCGDKIFALCTDLKRNPLVKLAYPDLIVEMKTKAINKNQWHLIETTLDDGRKINAHAHVMEAHKKTEGEGAVVAVFEGSIYTDHEEFSSSGKVINPGVMVGRGGDTYEKKITPQMADEHATAVAGVACADGKHNASGVAPQAKLLQISRKGGGTELDYFKYAVENGADVINNSWGYPTDYFPKDLQDAIDYATQHGKNGKGCAVVFASGNDGVPIRSLEKYKNVIAVGSCDSQNKYCRYSDYGNEIFCVFPSDSDNPRAQPSIWTTDNPAPYGYNKVGKDNDKLGKYTKDFGGTSSAAPGVAGVIALIRSVKGGHLITLDKVKEIIMKTCDKIDRQKADYQPHSVTGHEHSKYTGYGRVNAARAVHLAELLGETLLRAEQAEKAIA